MQPTVTPTPRRRLRLWPKRRLWKIVTSIALVLVLLLLTSSGTGYYLISKSLPVVEGTLKLHGLDKPVTVWRDDHGVPHIEATDEHDLYLAQGYVTAQDRMFQMDLSRRQASGELSEVVGEKALSRDKFFRTFGLRRAAEASLSAYSQEAKQVLDWYAQGVNAYIAQAKADSSLPIEFTLLGYQPRDWSAVDSLTIGKYMAFDLGGHWQEQAFHYDLAQHLSSEKALDLFPSYPVDAPTIIQAMKDHPLDVGPLLAEAVKPNPFNGSNNWVVSGSKTASGKPLLANDPHLSLNTPSIWYETNLKAPTLNVSGVIFAGIPGIILGHNDHIAWGVTNVGPDVQDLYMEKRNPANENEFEYQGKWEPAQVIHEEIKVKDAAAVPYDVRITRHGPIISEFANDKNSDTVLSMKWTALQPSSELEAVQRFAKATNWEEFKQALTYFQTPAQNFVFASQDGTIAYRANGLIPIRTKGDASTPVPGWTGEYEWQGFIPWEELPTTVNPPSGYIATANNKVVGDDYKYHLSNVWAQPYREKEISQTLAGKSGLTAEDMQKLQFDPTNLQAKEFLPILTGAVQKQKDKLRDIDLAALKVLFDWDARDTLDAGGSLVYNLWESELPNVLFKPELSEETMALFEDKAGTVDHLIRNAANGKPGPWVQEKGGLDAVALTSFQRAVDRAVELQGKDASKWNWGDFHQVPFHHPLAAVKPLDLLFDPAKTPVPGSKVTVEAAGWDTTNGEVNHGGAWRTVVDLSNLTQTYNVVGPGQSGHLLSPWYDDQVKDWTTGGYHVTSTDPKVYQQKAKQLTLTP
ncbi:penicillin acylase family protein [Tumebacillus sp. ITR2]|uniref:Penicillin acylase family protein n=1 Tax=Tumebacillus amylolyticus TaxID=2801339 RepID=A0ABS1J4N0_9BACL|nr:penicillin acylase family protein [Tumebacillus amylolyticus]MBL0385242.1 penicillin acylase family protein [Tumebacillus amylolyticus]